MCGFLQRKEVIAGATAGRDREAGSKGGPLDAFQGRGVVLASQDTPTAGVIDSVFGNKEECA